ncbi:MAG: hypothetical protein WBO23_06540 [Burkholderiales bacterium]
MEKADRELDMKVGAIRKRASNENARASEAAKREFGRRGALNP